MDSDVPCLLNGISSNYIQFEVAANVGPQDIQEEVTSLTSKVAPNKKQADRAVNGDRPDVRSPASEVHARWNDDNAIVLHPLTA
ncbi:MAG: hypothetical protein AB7J35_09605 [Dehalococcoidia bacterium]